MSAAFLQEEDAHHGETCHTHYCLDRPAIAINPNVLLPSLLGSWRVEVVSEALRAVVVGVIILTLGRPWPPAPDFVQLDVDARLDLFAHIS